MFLTSAPGHCSAAQGPQIVASPPPRECPTQSTLEGVAPPDIVSSRTLMLTESFCRPHRPWSISCAVSNLV